MPVSLNGIGTSYYGSRDRGEDGSCVTTLFVIFLAIPIIPLASYRVLATGKGTHLVIVNSQDYSVRRVPLNWKQVANVYLATLGILAVIALLGWLGAKWLYWYTSS
jgi:hypothetical protein